jgi:uncharacterized protein with ParB-like and HNH nuclease domain
MESTINKLFESQKRKFEIPSYQRAYAWDAEHIIQFIEDLQNSVNQYYLGHFLFEIKEENTLYVIDGQQRLTTCVIFFSVIIDELKKRRYEDNSYLDDLTNYYLKDLRKETQKFKTVSDDNNFFYDEIIENNENHTHSLDTTSKNRIKIAKQTFLNEFSKASIDQLVKWTRLVENASLTSYIVKDKIQATQVFAFQNDRGKDLSKLEIIKAYFMLQIYLSNNSKDKVEETIVYLEHEISKIYKQIVRIKANEDEVLNYYWRTVSGEGFYSKEVIKGIKEKINSLSENKINWIKDFILGLSKAFQSVEKFEKSKNSYALDLQYLNNMALSFPFIIKAYNSNDDKSIIRLLQLLENITFRFLLRGGRAEIESRLNGPLKDLHSTNLNDVIDQVILSLKTNDWWHYWSDEEMERCLNEFFYKNRVDNYLLWKYELFVSNSNHPKPHSITFDDLIKNESIEHIAPQTPTNGDPIANGYGVYEDNNNPIEGIISGKWLNRLGNLMLISQSHNSSIGNKPFSEKLISYGRDNLLNQQKEIVEKFVLDKNFPVWDKQSIEKRQNILVMAAKEIWDLGKI